MVGQLFCRGIYRNTALKICIYTILDLGEKDLADQQHFSTSRQLAPGTMVAHVLQCVVMQRFHVPCYFGKPLP
jgi:hypothetical protein